MAQSRVHYVWESALPGLPSEADIGWTILDDIHFKNVELDDKDLYGYYATEDRGSVLKVYATSKALCTQFASEWNFNLLGGGHNPQAYYHINEQENAVTYFDNTAEHTGGNEFHIGNTYLQQNMGFQLSKKAT